MNYQRNEILNPLPDSIAIAGAWGYIGRKFLDVALAKGLQTYVYDPGPAPIDVELGRLVWVDQESDFYQLDVDLFHLAVHPEYRRLDLLLERGEPLLILNEKPMAEPGRPAHCRQIVEAVANSRAILFYDFPELFDPLTTRLLEFLSRFKDVELSEIFIQRSKDREDPDNLRNYKRMVPIQYQESVHCIAFVLHLLAVLKGGIQNALAGGLRLSGRSDPYEPPNPEAYPEVVDGRCQYQMSIEGVSIQGCTDFKRNAEWAKRRIVRGLGDGKPFELDLSYLEGQKHYRINGADQACDPTGNSYEHVLVNATRWARQFDRDQLMTGLFPNPSFTQITYQLSSALWRSCQDLEEIAFHSFEQIGSWDSSSISR